MNPIITNTANPIPVTASAPRPKKRRRIIGILMDRSYSMKEMAPEVEAGVADFLDEQAKAEEDMKAKGERVSTEVLLAQFGSEYDAVYGPVKLEDAPEYRMEAKGMTALYDSIGTIVEALRARVAEKKANGRKVDVTLVVMTDGGENHSKRIRTSAAVREIVEECRAQGWQVLFLAANQDAVLTGQSLGVAPDMALTYNASTASGGVLRAAGAAVSMSYASGVPVSFSEADRSAVQ